MSRRKANRERGSAESSRPSGTSEEDLALTTRSGIFGGLGLVTVVAGFVLLSMGSINLAPILLVIGFLGFFPLALIR
jgi:hypothetical protein